MVERVKQRKPIVAAPTARPPELSSDGGLLGLAIGVVVIAALYVAQDVLVPITLAVLLSFVLSPIVGFFRRLGLWKAPSVLFAMLIALGALGAVGTLVATQAASLSAGAPQYAQTIQDKVNTAKAYAASRTKMLAEELGERPRGAREVPRAPTVRPRMVGEQVVPVRIVEAATTPLKLAQAILAPVVAPLETFLIVLVVAIFILLQKEDLRDRVIRLFGTSDLHRTTLALDEAGSRLSRYFLSQLAVNTTFGLVIGSGLWLIGVPVPALWGVLAGVLRFVPYVGALMGAALPLALAAAVDPGWTMAIEVALLFAVVEPTIGYVVEPLLYGHSTGLSPISVIVAAVFWTWLWGPIGLILSMPLTLCLVVLGRHVRSLEFLDVLLGDRPALTPVESFYQRMLADDPEEAIEQAEELLKSRSLTAYYDEVALAGLKLTAIDAERGVIDRAGVSRIARSMMAVIEELEDHDDARLGKSSSQGDATSLSPLGNGEAPIHETARITLTDAPPLWQDAGSVMCVAGRGPLDEVVTGMLAQLLQKRGFGTQRVAHDSVSRETIEALDVSRTEMICLSYLEIGGSPAHLRYLVKRLRRRAPDAAILVGLWPEGEAALSDRGIQHALGANVYVGKLGEAVEACLKTAADWKTSVVAA